jgi:8-oxo-dGTP pyrophosphatase MutT (NUDIX family)
MTPWKTLAREKILDMGKFLVVEKHTVGLPNGREIPDWAWIITPDYASIAAVTPEGKFLCFRQIKYAIEGISLAPAGGFLDLGETPLEAAKRELLEETGYAADDWIEMGCYAGDANRGCGKAYMFLAKGAHPVAPPNDEDLEEHVLLQLTRAEVEDALKAGDFRVLGWMAVMALALLHLD